MLKKTVTTLVLVCVIGLMVAPAGATPVTITLGADDCQDVSLRKGSPDQNWGALQESNVSYGVSTGTPERFLMRYDFSSIPAGQVITSAVLTMKLQGCHSLEEAISIPFYKMLKPWVEGTSSNDGATWNESNYSGTGANAWQSGGAWGAEDRETTAFASGILNHENGTRTTWDITSAVQDWYANPATNYGWMASNENSVRYVSFFSYDRAAVEDRPVLTITYDVPEPATMSLLGLGGLAALLKRRR